MPTGNEQLIVQLEARTRDFERQLAKANATVNRQVTAMEKRFAAMNPKIASLGRQMFGDFAKGAALALAPILSVGAAVRGAQDALKEFGDVADNAAAAGLDSELFQSLTYQAKLAGVEITQTAAALATFAKNSGLAAEGKGRMVTALKALDPALLENIRNARNQEERIRLIADALDKTADPAKKAAIATAAFGDAGLKLVAAFKGGASSIDETMRKARELGIVVDRDLIARADELGDSFDTASQILDTRLKQALVSLAPILTWLTGLAGDFAGELSIAIDSIKPLKDQTAATIRAEIERLRTNPPQRMGFDLGPVLGGVSFGGVDQEATDQKIRQLQQELFRRADQESMRRLNAETPPTTPDVPTLEEIETRNRAAAEAIKQAEAVKQLIANLQFEQDQVGKTALETAIATAQRQAGAAATDEQRAKIAEIISATEAERLAIEKNSEAMEAFASIAKDALGGFIRDLIDGKSAGEALGNVLGQLGDRLIGAGLDSLFSTSPGSPLASLFGLPKKEHGGPVRAGQPYLVGEKRAEVFVPDQPGRILPSVGSLRGMSAGGGSISAPVSITIDARGADGAGLARVEGQVARLRAELPSKIVGTVRDARKRRLL